MAVIAERSFASLNTIRAHVSHIHQKAGVHTQQELKRLVSGLEP